MGNKDNKKIKSSGKRKIRGNRATGTKKICTEEPTTPTMDEPAMPRPSTSTPVEEHPSSATAKKLKYQDLPILDREQNRNLNEDESFI